MGFHTARVRQHYRGCLDLKDKDARRQRRQELTEAVVVWAGPPHNCLYGELGLGFRAQYCKGLPPAPLPPTPYPPRPDLPTQAPTIP